MKRYFLLFTILTCGLSFLHSQSIDTAGNYFVYYKAKMNYFQQEADSNGLQYYQVDGWKTFIRQALFMHGKYDATGNMTEYAKALDEYYNTITDNTPARIPTWEYIGHDEIYQNFGSGGYSVSVGQGNISCIWVNKNNLDHIIAGGNAGSVWKTTDGGDNWSCISDTEPLMDGTRSIYVDMLNPNKIYVVQGHSTYSNGLFSTTNCGVSWIKNKVYVPNVSRYYYPSATEKYLPKKWIINPNNDLIMFLLTRGEVLRSLDGGLNWEVLISRDFDFWTYDQSFNDIEFDPVDPSIIYVSGPEVFRLTQNGDNITDITSDVLQWSQNTTGYYKVLIGTQSNYPDKIWFAVNSWGGKDALLYYNKTLNNYNLLKEEMNLLDEHKMQCEISPLNSDHLSIGGVNTYLYDHLTGNDFNISKSNIPTNWTHVDVRDSKYMDDGNGNEVLFFGNDGGVFRADPTDIITDWNWTYLANDGTNGIRNGHLHGFDCSNSSNDILYAGFQDMNSALNIDDQWYRILGGDGGPGTIDKTDPNYMYLSYFNSPAYIKKTSNMWADYETLINTVSYAYPPIVLSPADPNKLFIGDRCKIYIFDNVRNNNNHNTWTIIDDNNGAGVLNFEEIAVAESNDSVIYASTGRYWPGWVPQPDPLVKSLFKSVDGGTNWTDISDNIKQALYYESITGITINPWNENELWLCFGTISSSTIPNLAKKVYHSINGGISWEPMANGLPEKIPANEIVFDKRGGVLYLATDVGVYYYSEVENIWYNITGNRPTTFIGQIRFNYPLNKIRLGTHGRGIWQADIPCMANRDTMFVFNDTTWALPQHPYADIIIDEDATLTITGEVYMATETKIIVKPGGKLILNGGTLTNACGELWGGVEVWGDPEATQIPANQGWLSISNGGTIENAVVAVRVGSADYSGMGGGIIHTDEAIFHNNRSGVIMHEYAGNNLGNFNLSTFETTAELVDGTLPDAHIRLLGVEGISITGCTFQNTRDGNTPYSQRGIGILSFDASYYVDHFCISQSMPCTQYQKTVFDSLYYGIEAYAISATKAPSIKNTQFSSNFRGIYLSGITLARVTSNSFYLNGTAASKSYGLYLDGCTRYWVEDNHFEKSSSQTSQTGIGIYVSESGNLANEIYLNSFESVEYAVVALGNNRYNRRPEIGLQIRCNDYNNTLFDEVVVYDGWLAPPTDDGIASLQGANTTNAEDMAGNLFYYNTDVAGDFDDINNQSNHFYYYYSMYAGTLPVEPLDYTTSTVTKVAKTINNWTYEVGCPSGLSPSGGGSTEESRSAMAEAQANIESTEAVLLALVDGGDTETLNTEVQSSTPSETETVYSELMAESPNLSETVVESTIEKETVLPNAMVRDVMVANPHTSTSLQLLDKLDQRTNPMPAFMKAQILTGRSISSLKAELEGQVAMHQIRKAKAMNRIARQFDEMPASSAKTDSLLALYQADNSITSRYMQAWLYMQSGQYLQGQNVMTDIPSDFTLSANEQAEHQNMQSLYTMLSDLHEARKQVNELSAAQQAQLEAMVPAKTGLASIFARNILVATDAMQYSEPVTLPNQMKSASTEEVYKELNNAPIPKILEVYPNPSKDFVVLGYRFNSDNQGVIEIRDASGSLIHSIPFAGMQDQLTVITFSWSPGIYMVSLMVNERVIETTKFTLIN